MLTRYGNTHGISRAIIAIAVIIVIIVAGAAIYFGSSTVNSGPTSSTNSSSSSSLQSTTSSLASTSSQPSSSSASSSSSLASSSASSSGTTSTSQSSSIVQTATTSNGGPSNGTLVIDDNLWPNRGANIWAALVGSAYPAWPEAATYQTLVAVNVTDEQQNGNITYLPDLANNWTVSPSGEVYTFNLRNGVLFSNGDPFNAYQVWANYYLQ
ncbi:MAG: ABC transporter substrate-binding protein, partial [Nitrososphaerales archaeon]